VAWQSTYCKDASTTTHAEEETGAAEEPQAAEEAHDGEGGSGPEEGLEEMHGTVRCARLDYVSEYSSFSWKPTY
jgi:hypothetical protein